MFRAAKLFSQNVRLLLTESRRSPAAAGLPRPEGRLGGTRGLELSPCSVFLHECCRYPSVVLTFERCAAYAADPDQTCRQALATVLPVDHTRCTTSRVFSCWNSTGSEHLGSPPRPRVVAAFPRLEAPIGSDNGTSVNHRPRVDSTPEPHSDSAA